jgi:hypothetical protein
MGRNGFPAESEEGHDEFVRVWRSGGESLLPKEPKNKSITICIYAIIYKFPSFPNLLYPTTTSLHNLKRGEGW